MFYPITFTPHHSATVLLGSNFSIILHSQFKLQAAKYVQMKKFHRMDQGISTSNTELNDHEFHASTQVKKELVQLYPLMNKI